jgi:diguanylate cyclase (GGDEF)-like protein
MDETILNSVIEITNKRDIDSLEISMTLALVEQIECLRLVIYKKVNTESTLTIRSNIDLVVHDSEPKYEWLEPAFIQTVNPELTSCFKFSCLIHNKLDNENTESWHPIVIGQQTVAVVYLKSIKLTREQQVLLNGFCRIYENYLSILKESECDKLTGLLNRQTFEGKVKRFIEQKNKKQSTVSIRENRRSPEQNSSIWLAIIDLDNFKHVNDRFGHVCGDEVLLTFAQLMKNHFRNEDLLFRFGGEEFILVMEATTSKIMHRKLDEFKNVVASHQFPLIEFLTVSIGFTLLDPNMFISSVVDRSDKALYYAKENGRNTVHCFEDLIENKLLQRHEPDINSPIELF